MKQSCYFLSLILVGLFSCSQQLQLPKDDSLNGKALLPFRIDTVIFVDKRSDTLTTEMELPLIISRSKQWTIKPGLGKATKEEIAFMIRNASYTEGLPVNVTVTVLDGYYKVTGNATKVGEHTLFDCELLFTLIDSGASYKSNSKANYDFVGVFNATEEHARKMYNITVRNSIFNALKRAERSLED